MKKREMSNTAAAMTGLGIMIVLAGLLIAVSGPVYKAISGRNRPISEVPIYNPGVYEGSARGYNGPVTVKIEVTEYEMKEVQIDAPDETPEIGKAAAAELAKEIWQKQTYSVDSISGATATSNAVNTALAESLKKAAREGTELYDMISAKDAAKEEQDTSPGIDALLKDTADGQYSYLSDTPDDKGFCDSIEMTVKDHKITALTWDSVKADGTGKRQLSEGGQYTMTEDGPLWYEQADTLSRYVIENQTEEGLSDGTGYGSDAVASVSIYIGGFEDAVKKCLMQQQ